jgi:soluble lytic murein transglycosylase
VDAEFMRFSSERVCSRLVFRHSRRSPLTQLRVRFKLRSVVAGRSRPELDPVLDRDALAAMSGMLVMFVANDPPVVLLDGRPRALYNRAVRWLRLALILGGLVALNVAALIGWLRGRRERSQDAVILAAARRHDVDPALVKAVVWCESRFNPRARGKAGEIGLMQIREPAAREWAQAEGVRPFAHETLFDPGTNTLAGAWYLARLLKRYAHTDDPLPYALADYNAGRSHVLRWNHGAGATNSAVFLQQMTFPGTRRYIEAVVQRRARYHGTFPGS